MKFHNRKKFLKLVHDRKNREEKWIFVKLSYTKQMPAVFQGENCQRDGGSGVAHRAGKRLEANHS